MINKVLIFILALHLMTRALSLPLQGSSEDLTGPLTQKEIDNSFYNENVGPVVSNLSNQKIHYLLSASLLLTYGAFLNDSQVRDQWKDHKLMSEKTADLGDFIGTGLPGLTTSIFQLYFDHDNGVKHFRGLVYETLLVYTLKTLASRQRPGGSDNYQSFPSGHSATAFLTAHTLTKSYGWKHGFYLYPLATLTALSRLADDAHYFSDIVAGAFVGVIVSELTYYDFKNEPIENNTDQDQFKIKIIPVLKSNGAEVLILSKF